MDGRESGPSADAGERSPGAKGGWVCCFLIVFRFQLGQRRSPNSEPPGFGVTIFDVPSIFGVLCVCYGVLKTGNELGNLSAGYFYFPVSGTRVDAR